MQLVDLIDHIDFDKSGMREKMESEVGKINKFRLECNSFVGVLATSTLKNFSKKCRRVGRPRTAASP